MTGLTDVRSTLYTIHSMGQDGDSYVASRIEGREIDLSGSIRERDPVKARELRDANWPACSIPSWVAFFPINTATSSA